MGHAESFSHKHALGAHYELGIVIGLGEPEGKNDHLPRDLLRFMRQNTCSTHWLPHTGVASEIVLPPKNPTDTDLGAAIMCVHHHLTSLKHSGLPSWLFFFLITLFPKFHFPLKLSMIVNVKPLT